jgi:hypothetical protein
MAKTYSCDVSTGQGCAHTGGLKYWREKAEAAKGVLGIVAAAHDSRSHFLQSDTIFNWTP